MVAIWGKNLSPGVQQATAVKIPDNAPAGDLQLFVSQGESLANLVNVPVGW